MKAKAHETGIEGLRGLAALSVLYTHLLCAYEVDPGYSFWSGWKMLEASHGAVLLFFVLSGYVIGLTNQTALTPTTAADYARRRILRLVPICWLAILLSFAVRPEDGARVVFANLFFLQNHIPYGNLFLPPLGSNQNLWTLNYEALYYGLFILIWWRPKLWPAWLASSFAVSLLAWRLPGNWAPLIACYAMGWIFWLSGFGLARVPVSPPSPGEKPLPWPSLMLFGLITWQTKPLWNLCRRFDLLPPECVSAWINYSFIEFLPVCIVLMAIVANRRPRFLKPLCLLVAVWPTLFTLWSAARGRTTLATFDHAPWTILLGWLLWRWRPDPQRAWSRLAGLGALSYGIYILHRPAQWLVRDAAWLPSGNIFSFALRQALVLGLTLGLAWWAEKHFQPWVRGKFRGKTAPRHAPA